MNASWETLMEQDAQKGQTYETIILQQTKHREGTKHNHATDEEKEEVIKIVPLADEVHDGKPKIGNLDKEERTKVINSVRLTKALVLLGYSCWSQLEPGRRKVYL